jgi:hypothetical protein
MSWESVVETPVGAAGSTATDPEPADAQLAAVPPATTPAPTAPPATTPAPTAPPAMHAATAPAPASPTAPLASTPLVEPAQIDSVAAAPSPVEPAVEPIAFAPLTLSLDDEPNASAPSSIGVSDPSPSTPVEEPPTFKLAPLVPIVPADAESIAGSEARVDAPDSSTELPQIVEATPVPVTVEESDESGESAFGPRLPTSHQPDQRHVAPVQVLQVPTSPTPERRRRSRGRGGLKLMFALLVLAGVIAAAVVYGRQYLFPVEWDATTEPYAVAVEDGRDADFAEPIAVISEPTADYGARMAAQLTGDWSDDATMWRALGLLSGTVTADSVAGVLEGWQAATYSTADGQVYRDQAADGAQLDAAITQEMVAAQLDQQYGWSAEQPNRTLDDAAQTMAQVEREARRVQESSVFAAEIEPLEPALSIFAPPVLGYRALAPTVFAEFTDPGTADDLGLADLGTGGPGPLPTETPSTAPEAEVVAGDAVSASPRAMDRSFWYLVFAGYLDTRTSYQASEAVVENSVVMADRAGRACAYATFAGGDVVQTPTLRQALESWVAAVPVELSASFSVLADGTLQVVSCDPGPGFDNGSRLGIARELIGWRIAELATIEAVADGIGADLTTAWAAVEASNAGIDLASLPPETEPAASAAAARDAVRAILVPAG